MDDLRYPADPGLEADVLIAIVLHGDERHLLDTLDAEHFVTKPMLFRALQDAHRRGTLRGRGPYPDGTVHADGIDDWADAQLAATALAAPWTHVYAPRTSAETLRDLARLRGLQGAAYAVALGLGSGRMPTDELDRLRRLLEAAA